eukprot:scaffold3243_cov173-Ochromonas_danica.AAC.44
MFVAVIRTPSIFIFWKGICRLKLTFFWKISIIEWFSNHRKACYACRFHKNSRRRITKTAHTITATHTHTCGSNRPPPRVPAVHTLHFCALTLTLTGGYWIVCDRLATTNHYSTQKSA